MHFLPFLAVLTGAASHSSSARPAPPVECPRLAASGGSTDLYCIHLIAAPGFSASGSVELSWTGGPYTVGVRPDGTHQWQLRFSLQDLPDSLLHGRRPGFLAWAVPPSMAQVIRLGVVHAGDTDLGPMALDRFLILISAEPDTTVREWRGRIIVRGESASNRLRPADNYQFFLGVAGDRAPAGMHDHHAMPS
ncbi:MAG: hypothetical protein ABI742_12950, partial [Gemmatimonadota bacterium]